MSSLGGEKAGRHVPKRSSRGHRVCVVWGEWGWGVTPLSFPAKEKGKWRARCWSLPPSTQCQGTWEWLTAACIRGASASTWGNINLQSQWSNPGTGFLESYSMPHACQCLRAIWITHLTLRFNFWSPLKWSDNWTRWSFSVPSNSTLLFPSIHSESNNDKIIICLNCQRVFSSKNTFKDT